MLLMKKPFADIVGKGENIGNTMYSTVRKSDVEHPFPKWQILDSSKLKEIADDNLNFDNMAESYPKG